MNVYNNMQQFLVTVFRWIVEFPVFLFLKKISELRYVKNKKIRMAKTRDKRITIIS